MQCRPSLVDAFGPPGLVWSPRSLGPRSLFSQLDKHVVVVGSDAARRGRLAPAAPWGECHREGSLWLVQA